MNVEVTNMATNDISFPALRKKEKQTNKQKQKQKQNKNKNKTNDCTSSQNQDCFVRYLKQHLEATCLKNS